ncbi:MAG: DUF3445 domain-containing protein [Pirellulaceae bacterium]
MKYFPFTSNRFEHQFGIRAIPAGETIVEATDLYANEIQQKRQQLDRDTNSYFAATPDSLMAQREAAAMIGNAASFLTPDHNDLIDEPIEIDDTAPLLSISQHVQEDLAIMSGNADAGFPLIAGSICFPNGWSVTEKLGQSLLAIHSPVPEYASVLHAATERLMNALRSNRPVWRMNWGIRPSEQLDQSTIHISMLDTARQRITAENAGETCWFRVERQTLAQLPSTKAVLFTIHTHQCPLDELTRSQKETLRGVLQSCPVETLKYKGIYPMLDAVTTFLKST